MGWNPVPVDYLEAEPSAVRELAHGLRALGAALLGCGAAFRAGGTVPTQVFEGRAGGRFRARCLDRRAEALATAVELESLSGAADELARDLDDLRLLLQQVRGVAHGGGLEVGGAAVWPPHPAERREDTPALRAAWSAYDRCWTLRETFETRRDAAERAWRTALRDVPVRGPHRPRPEPGSPALPPAGAPSVGDRVLSPVEAPPHRPEDRRGAILGGTCEPRYDERSRARWIEGHRDSDGACVHAHWQPVGPDGHGSGAVEVTRVPGFRDDDGTWHHARWREEGHPHAGEHPSGARLARWVDGRWEPVGREPRPPSVA